MLKWTGALFEQVLLSVLGKGADEEVPLPSQPVINHSERRTTSQSVHCFLPAGHERSLPTNAASTKHRRSSWQVCVCVCVILGQQNGQLSIKNHEQVLRSIESCAALLCEVRCAFQIDEKHTSTARTLTPNPPLLCEHTENQRALSESKSQLMDREAGVKTQATELAAKEAALAQQQQDVSARAAANEAREKSFAAEQVGVVLWVC